MKDIRVKKLITMLIMIGSLALISLIMRFIEIPIGCFFRVVTGVPCPGCGSTRALVALSYGNILDSLYFNPVVFIILICFLISIVWLIIDLIRNSYTFLGLKNINLSYKFYIVISLFILANWIWNIYKYI